MTRRYEAPIRISSALSVNRRIIICGMVKAIPATTTEMMTENRTCCPSDTHFCLSLGPDLPRADQLYPGILGYSANRILTYFSLLIPAFSLQCSPLLLTVQLRPAFNAPLPTFRFRSFGSMFQPRTFSAQDLSTSELLRTL